MQGVQVVQESLSDQMLLQPVCGDWTVNMGLKLWAF